MNNIKVSFRLLTNIYLTKKDFILYDVDCFNNITAYKFSNDLARYRKKFTNFKLVQIIKQDIKITL